MKVFLVLAIAVLSGCNANLSSADESKPKLEVVREAIMGTIEEFRKTEYGQDLDSLLKSIASNYHTVLSERIPDSAHEAMNKFITDVNEQTSRLKSELSNARVHLEPLKDGITATLDKLKRELAELADSTDSETMRTTLMQKSDELKSSLELCVKDMQVNVGAYTEDLKAKMMPHLNDFTENMAVATENLQGMMSQRAARFQQMAAPYAEDLQSEILAFYQSLVDTN